MKQNKVYIIGIVIVVVFALLLVFFFGRDSLKKGRQQATLIIGDNTVWSYQDKRWINLSSSSIRDLSWKEYEVYLNREKTGKYYLWHDDKWYAFDEDKNAINLSGDLIAYQSNFPIKFAFFQEKNVDVDSYIQEVLNQNNLDISSEFTSKYMVSFDYDQDNVEEAFYVISNAFTSLSNVETIFSIVFMVDDQKIYPIYNDITTNQPYNGCKPYFQSFVDVNDDNLYEFILSCGYYANSRQSDMLYRFDDGEFKIMISNQ